jgi:hypothetical protein
MGPLVCRRPNAPTAPDAADAVEQGRLPDVIHHHIHALSAGQPESSSTSRRGAVDRHVCAKQSCLRAFFGGAANCIDLTSGELGNLALALFTAARADDRRLPARKPPRDQECHAVT